ncbi:MAG: thiamine biosynthesis protein [Polyangiaceae bacterium]|nr:thiamine biosynthesis protein [Polyangiaceae bacterium]
MSVRKRRRIGLAAMYLGAALFGCSRGHTPPEAHSQPLVPSAAGVPLSASAASPSSAAGVTPSARLEDERWQRAKGEDLADKQALADALGAAGLLDALDDGGDITTTALASLPLADDADVALGPLAKRALTATNESRELLLSALLGIAGRPARAREWVDPEGAAEAGAAVLAIAKDEALPREHRALAVSAARALAEKKIVDPSQIPTDLDPP